MVHLRVIFYSPRLYKECNLPASEGNFLTCVLNRFLTKHSVTGGSASNVASASSGVLVFILPTTYTPSSYLADAMLFIDQKLST